MNYSRLEFLFQRYRNGSCTQEEELELMEIINQSDNPLVRQLLNDLWNESSDKLPEGKSERILNSILGSTGKTVHIQKTRFMWAKAAAITAFIALSGVAAYQLLNSYSEDISSDTMSHAAELPQQHQFIKLPDGSTVILNDASKLEYPDSFADKNSREVYLTGEAFFDIQHDDSKAFIVHTGKISTTVLGTAFNVKAYPEQNDITVTVTRGKVKVSNDVQLLGILAPDDQITFDKRSQQSKLRAVKSKEVITWAEKDIFFDDVSMLEAAKQLEERFQVEITFKNENIKACRFTATFVRGEDLSQILDVICEFNQAKYTVNESGDIEVSGNGCSQ